METTLHVQGSSYSGGQGAIHVQFLNQTRSSSFSFKHKGYCFYGCSDIILTRILTIFTMYATIFEQVMADFHFF